MASSTTKAIRKSSSAVTTAAIGGIKRGKYTLLIRCWLASRLLPALVTAFANRNQGSMPE